MWGTAIQPRPTCLTDPRRLRAGKLLFPFQDQLTIGSFVASCGSTFSDQGIHHLPFEI
jgi:hypothetical protein